MAVENEMDVQGASFSQANYLQNSTQANRQAAQASVVGLDILVRMRLLAHGRLHTPQKSVKEVAHASGNRPSSIPCR